MNTPKDTPTKLDEIMVKLFEEVEFFDPRTSTFPFTAFKEAKQAITELYEGAIPEKRVVANEGEHGWARSEAEPYNDAIDDMRKGLL